MILIVARVSVITLLLLTVNCGDGGHSKYNKNLPAGISEDSHYEGSISENSDSRGEYVLVKTLSGKGSKSTDEFRINSSKVKIKAKTWGASVGSFSSFSLESDSGRRVRGGSMTISTKSSESGGESSTTIRNLSPGGYYYIKAISGIHWEVNVYEYR